MIFLLKFIIKSYFILDCKVELDLIIFRQNLEELISVSVLYIFKHIEVMSLTVYVKEHFRNSYLVYWLQSVV